jgi:hypothetical protein
MPRHRVNDDAGMDVEPPEMHLHKRLWEWPEYFIDLQHVSYHHSSTLPYYLCESFQDPTCVLTDVDRH